MSCHCHQNQQLKLSRGYLFDFVKMKKLNNRSKGLFGNTIFFSLRQYCGIWVYCSILDQKVFRLHLETLYFKQAVRLALIHTGFYFLYSILSLWFYQYHHIFGSRSFWSNFSLTHTRVLPFSFPSMCWRQFSHQNTIMNPFDGTWHL